MKTILELDFLSDQTKAFIEANPNKSPYTLMNAIERIEVAVRSVKKDNPNFCPVCQGILKTHNQMKGEYNQELCGEAFSLPPEHPYSDFDKEVKEQKKNSSSGLLWAILICMFLFNINAIIAVVILIVMLLVIKFGV